MILSEEKVMRSAVVKDDWKGGWRAAKDCRSFFVMVSLVWSLQIKYLTMGTRVSLEKSVCV